jgi:hypothetical protein
VTSSLRRHLAFGLIPVESRVLWGYSPISNHNLASQQFVSLGKVGRCISSHHLGPSVSPLSNMRRMGKFKPSATAMLGPRLSIWVLTSCQLEQVTLQPGTLHIQQSSGGIQRNGHAAALPACLSFRDAASGQHHQGQCQLWLQVRVGMDPAKLCLCRARGTLQQPHAVVRLTL